MAAVAEDAVTRRLGRYLTARRAEMVRLVQALVAAAATRKDPEGAGLATVATAVREIGHQARVMRGRDSTRHLVVRPSGGTRRKRTQLVMGRVTEMDGGAATPIRDPDHLSGAAPHPEAGVAQLVFALAAIAEEAVPIPVAPVVVVCTGSVDVSEPAFSDLPRMAGLADRAFVLGPAIGPEGKLVTARRGSVRFDVSPHDGDLTTFLRRLKMLSGGRIDVEWEPVERANGDTLAVRARAWCEGDIDALQQIVAEAGVTGPVEGVVEVPPMERLEGNRRLWWRAVAAATELGVGLAEGELGSPGPANRLSVLTPTLDGLGAVPCARDPGGAGFDLARMPERAAVLARMLVDPPLEPRRN